MATVFKAGVQGHIPKLLLQMCRQRCTWLVANVSRMAAIVIVFNVVYIYAVYCRWKEHVVLRKKRSDPASPSNEQRPAVKTETAPGSPNMRKRIQKYRSELAQHAEKVCSTAAHAPQQGKAHTHLLRARSAPGAFSCCMNPDSTCELLSKIEAVDLDMDHIYLAFRDFLWASYFILPNSVYLWVRGFLVLKLREQMFHYGIISPLKHDSRRTCALLVLNGPSTSVAYQFQMIDKRGHTVAIFAFPNFPMLNNQGKYTEADLFSVEIDLSDCVLTKASIDGIDITSDEALILIWFYRISAGHVKIHAFSNWATNVQQFRFPFLRKMSVITVMYNYFGNTSFPLLCRMWWQLGLTTIDFSNVKRVFESGVGQGINDHGNILELAKFSETIDFLIKIRNHFMNEFQKERDCFPAIEGESLFLGTIVHSLDHTLMEWDLQDPLWLQTTGKYKTMAELGRLVRAGFVENLPGILFCKRYSDAPKETQLYSSVYAAASKLNKRLADQMDMCIIK
jgi:hypothetical protein